MTCRREIKSTRFVSEIDGSALASPKFAVGFANATMTNSACSPTRVSAMQIRGIWCRQSKISHAKQEDPVISFNIRCQMGRQRGRLERIVDALSCRVQECPWTETSWSIETAKQHFMRQKNNMHHAHLHPVPDAAGRPSDPDPMQGASIYLRLRLNPFSPAAFMHEPA